MKTMDPDMSIKVQAPEKRNSSPNIYECNLDILST